MRFYAQLSLNNARTQRDVFQEHLASLTTQDGVNSFGGIKLNEHPSHKKKKKGGGIFLKDKLPVSWDGNLAQAAF